MVKKKHKHGYYRSLKYPRNIIKQCCDNWRKMHGMPMLRHKTWWRARNKRILSKVRKYADSTFVYGGDLIRKDGTVRNYESICLEDDRNPWNVCRRAVAINYPQAISIPKKEEFKYYGCI